MGREHPLLSTRPPPPNPTDTLLEMLSAPGVIFQETANPRKGWPPWGTHLKLRGSGN